MKKKRINERSRVVPCKMEAKIVPCINEIRHSAKISMIRTEPGLIIHCAAICISHDSSQGLDKFYAQKTTVSLLKFFVRF